MENNQTIKSLLLLILIGAMISCSSSSKASLTENGTNENYNSAPPVASANKEVDAPAPAAKGCPTKAELFMPADVEEGKLKNHVGCTVTLRGKFIEVNSGYVMLQGFVGEQKTRCSGTFSSEIYLKIGKKLRGIDKTSHAFPTAEFAATVESDEGISGVKLTGCVMSNFSKND